MAKRLISILSASMRCILASGRASPCGWCARIVAMTWDRCARCWIRIRDSSSWLGGGSSSPNFIARINFAVTAATRCMPAKANGRCCAATAVNVTTRKLPPALSWQSVATMRSLLAQHTRHRNGVHTVLAGFVEVGETLEQAVAREVMEESGIRVKNLRYVTFSHGRSRSR